MPDETIFSTRNLAPPPRERQGDPHTSVFDGGNVANTIARRDLERRIRACPLALGPDMGPTGRGAILRIRC